MKIFKLVHTADLHLGSYFSSTPEISANRKIEQIDTLRRIIDICREREAAALLIAGDLFDSLRCEAQLLAEVQSILAESGLRVFIAPGNHDPATPDSSYNQPGWPDNVHIFMGGPECVQVTDDVCVWGVGFRHSIEAECLLKDFRPSDDCTNILMMHGDIVPHEGDESRYNPVTFDRLLSLGVDYCALGHSHRAFDMASGEFSVRMCGCPSGRGFDEQGIYGVYAGYVGKGFSHMEFVPTDCRRYISEKIDVSGCQAASDYCKIITEKFKSQIGEGYKEHIYDITLIGSLAKGIMPDTQLIARQLMEELHYARITDMTSTELDIDELMNESGLRGAFVRALVGRMGNDEKNRLKYERALLYGLRAFDGEVRINEDY